MIGRKHLPAILAFAVFLLAFAIRAQHLDWGLPSCYEEAKSVRHAWGFWGFETGKFTLNPEFFNYPTLYFYMQFLVQALLRLWGNITGGIPDADAFRVAWIAEPERFLLAGRYLTALLGAATCSVVFATGRKIGGLGVGLPAGLFMLFHSVHVEKSRFVEVDVPMTFFIALSYLFLVRFIQSGRGRDFFLAGVAVGLATSTKYPGAIFLLNLPLAAWIRGGPVRAPMIATGLACAVVAFCAASPYVILDFAVFRSDFLFESIHMKKGHLGDSTVGVPGALSAFVAGLGWPLLTASALGLFAAFRRGRSTALLFALMPALLFILLSVSRVQPVHYPLPAIPAMTVLVAMVGVGFAARLPRYQSIATALFTIVLLAVPVRSVAGELSRLTAADSRTEARKWIEENVPAGSLVLSEPHGPILWTTTEEQHYRDEPEYRSIKNAIIAATSGRPAYRLARLPFFTLEPNRADRFYRLDLLQWFDVIVLTGSMSDRYGGDPDRFEAQNRFYRDLVSRFRLAKTVEPTGGNGSRIRIFRREGTAPPARELQLDPGGAVDESFIGFVRKVAWFYREAGLGNASLAAYDAILKIQPGDVESLIQAGTLAGEQLGPEAGLPLLDRAVTIDRENHTAKKNRGVLLCQSGRLEEGAAVFRALLEEDGSDAEVHANLASALASLGRAEESIRHFEEFLRLEPNHPRSGEVRRVIADLSRDPGN